ncbi:hypothetical protein I4544_09045 [Klebsiella michiganensis]|uniref:hypothetical protein n=1 Tax=Klebsiella michiganensis TaxID=1134687 RepID=UPI0018C5CE80|nr:hypothetical protein [Klebsiella michiganensis]MBG2586391.1 hypothetical protein [Klebsiella michiganensis]
MKYTQQSDLIVEPFTSVEIAKYYGLPTTSSLLLQCKYGSMAFINNDGNLNGQGYVLVNSSIHQFETLPNPIFVANPSPYPITIAVAEIPMNQ